MRPRRVHPFVWVFILLWGLLAVWAVSTPLFGGPDEPGHVLRAVSVARGEVVGRDAPGLSSAFTLVRVPAVYGLGFRVGCWNGDPDVTPSCAGPFAGSHAETRLPTLVGRYLPVYYGFVGLPSLALVSAKGLYLMRILSAGIVAVFLTGALWAATRARRPGPLLLGVGFAITPMVVFLGGIVNPSGVEIASALCCWATTAVILDAGVERAGASLRWWWLASSVALILSRGLSLLWWVLIVVICVAMSERGRREVAAIGRALRRELVAVGVVAGATALWLALVGGLLVAPVGGPVNPRTPFASILRSSFGKVGKQTVRELIGVFQWLEVPAPTGVFVLWFAAVGLLLFVAIGSARRRHALVLGALVVAVLVVPALVEAPRVKQYGYGWQGRYALPMAVGIPVLAGWLVARARASVVEVVQRAGLSLAVLAGVAQLACFVTVARRDAVGLSGPLLYLRHPGWAPPVAAWALLVGAAAAIGALTVLWCAALRRPLDAARHRDDGA